MPSTVLPSSIRSASRDVYAFVRTLVRRGPLCACFASAVLLASASAIGQTAVTLPGTISAVAGSTPVTTVTGSACSTNSPFTATTANGDGCPAVNAKFGGTETSIAADPLGNVYISNNSANPQIVRKIDARTGLITQYAGFSPSQCASGAGTKVYGTVAAQTSKTGDGCPVSYSDGFNGPVNLGTDPYGNLLIASTGDLVLHLVCNAASPICSATQAGENLMITVAGCALSNSSYGTALSGKTPGTAGDGGVSTQFGGTACSVGVGGRIYGVTADKWDNIYFADATNGRFRVVAGAPSVTINGIVYTNPLYATLQTSTVAPNNYATIVKGNIYPIAGGGTVCAGKTDAYGDGCPFTQTTVNSTSSGALMQGIAVDAEGDFIFDDGNGNLRVIYEGGTVIKGALSANGIATPQLGYSYLLIGGGTAIYYNSGNPGVVLGTTASLQSGTYQILSKDPAGNILIGDQQQILFFDIATGYVRRIGAATTTVCTPSLDTLGDGCALNQSNFGQANKPLPIAEDALGNLYMLDVKNLLVRRISTTALPTTAVNSSLSSTLTVHAPVAGTSITVTPGSGGDYTVGASNCTTNADSSVDCTAPVTYTPTQLAQRSEPVTIATTGGLVGTQTLALSAPATGSALVFDTATTPATTVLAPSTTGNTGVLTDGFGNTYVSNAAGISKISGSAITPVTTTAAKYFAVDAAGDVYTTAGSTTTITEYVNAAGAYTTSTITLPSANICTSSASSISCAATQVFSGPLTVDAAGAIYIADLTNLQVIKFTQSGYVARQLTQTRLTAPTAMTQDSYGNLLILDGTNILEVPAFGYPTLTTSPTANTPIKLAATLTAPTSIAVDQGENIYIADAGSIKVQSASNAAQTATDYQYTLPGVSGTGVAVDGTGNLYLVQSSVNGVTQVLRNAQSFGFGANYTQTFVGVLGNAGATNSTGLAQTDTFGDFAIGAPATALATSAPACSLASTALVGGGVCNASITFPDSGGGTGVISDAITLLPAANTLGAVNLTGTGNGITETSTTAITGNTSGLVYTTGTETTFTVTVSETPAKVPSGTVAVVIDGGTPANYTLTPATSSSSTATVTIAGLSATSHTIVASYGSGATGSTSSPVNFTIAAIGTVSSWAPATTTIQYSAAIGTGVLNATAQTTSGSAVSGAFVYTATPSAGGAALPIHSASYLPIGTYSLTATFYPTDAVDYTSSSANVGSFSVTQATTSAPIGATQMLVAADGTGNFTTVQAAVNTLPNGGSIYIKPGTYPGFITVVQPNLFLRGLGGDPTKVILTHEAGAFGSTYPYTGEFQQTGINANNGGSNGYQLPTTPSPGSTIYTGDEGSATIVVARGINTALGTTQLIPNNFYAENLSFINGYNTDTTTTTTTYETSANGTCVTGQSTPQTYSALYNAGTLCGSQALAIWMTSDLAVLNNVNFASLQDTVYTASPGSGSSGQVPSRQYWFRGKITGDVDYIFGDAAAVFDSTTIYSAFHGSATGTVTIHAQNQSQATPAYLSGYILNNAVLTSQAPGMTNLYFGRPYGTYSTWVMLNSYIDQVNPTGYTTGLGPSLTNNTFLEFNDIPYTDPTPNTADINGVLYVGTGGNTGSGVTGTRENLSTNPGTPEATNNPPTTLTLPQAQAFFPTNFLSRTVPSAISSTTNWNPTAALAANVNSFVPTTSPTSITYGQTITLLVRPQTPGLGVIPAASYNPSSPTPAVFTIPTGTYTIYDNGTQIATGTLDASGEAYFITSALTAGKHSFTWTYSGDSNFAGSTTSTAYALTVVGLTPVVTLSSTTNPITYGQSASVSVAVSGTGATPTGSVSVSVDNVVLSGSPYSLSNGSALVGIPGLTAGNHAITATYTGDTVYASGSSASAYNLSVQKATLNIAGTCSNRAFYTANTCSVSIGSYQNGDTAGTVFSMAPMATTAAVLSSPAGNYPTSAAYTLSTFGTANYTVVNTPGSFTITGGGNAAQQVIFAPLPNLPAGTYQLTARTTSGLPVTYTVTGSGASISGSTLTLSGATGNIIQVTATATDPHGDYATASAVRSFTAK